VAQARLELSHVDLEALGDARLDRRARDAGRAEDVVEDAGIGLTAEVVLVDRPGGAEHAFERRLQRGAAEPAGRDERAVDVEEEEAHSARGELAQPGDDARERVEDDVDLTRRRPAPEREAERALERITPAADRAQHVRGLAGGRVAGGAGGGRDAAEVQLHEDAVRLHARDDEGRVVREPPVAPRPRQARVRQSAAPTASTWKGTPRSRASPPTTRTGSSVPISPFAAMTETRAVSSRSAHATACGSTQPSASTPTYVTLQPRFSRSRHALRTEMCSTAESRRGGPRRGWARRRTRGWLTRAG